MDVIEITRQLGTAIQEDARYIAYSVARETNDNDTVLQDLIGEFNLQRMALNTEVSKEEKDEAKVAELDSKLRELYGTIMANENMVKFNDAKTAMDELVSSVNGIISMAIEGEDPLTCDPSASSCGSDCGSCGGSCH